MVEQKVVNHASEGRPYAVLFWLGVTLADHTAEGDLMQLARNGALHLFFVPYRNWNAQRGIPQDRDCLTAASTGGVETSCVFHENVGCFRAVGLFGSRNA